MSIISGIDFDDSSALAKRFALATASYLDAPTADKRAALQVPLENLFRLLEMFRYGAFSDEPRAGVLALDAVNVDARQTFARESSWHAPIERALIEAVSEVFADKSLDNAVNELQDGLRDLARSGAVSDRYSGARVRRFLDRFQSTLVSA